MDNILLTCGSIFLKLEPVTPDPLSTMALNAYCTFMVIVAITSVAGNILVITVICKFRVLWKQSNAYLVSLAVADVLVAVVVMPLQIYETWNRSWDLSKRACYLRNVFDGSMIGVTILSLCVLAVDRYLAVYHPLVLMKITHPMAGAAIAFCWIVPLLMWTVLFVTGWHLTGLETYEFCLMFAGYCVYIRNTANICSITFFSFVLPSALFIFVYSKIFLTARKQARAIRDTNLATEDKQKISTLISNTKSAVIPCIIVLAFLLCWVPFYFTLTADVIGDLTLVDKQLLDAFLWLGYIDSLINPILYFIFSPDFRFAFKRLFYCKASEMSLTETS